MATTNVKQNICRVAQSRELRRELLLAAGDDDEWSGFPDDREGDSAGLDISELGINLLVQGLAADRAAREVFWTLVQGRQFCVQKFWQRFPRSLMAWRRSCACQNLLFRVNLERLDATTGELRRQLNHESNAVLAQRLLRFDPAHLADRIDEATGGPHANIMMIYSVAYILRREPALWREFKHLLICAVPHA